MFIRFIIMFGIELEMRMGMKTVSSRLLEPRLPLDSHRKPGSSSEGGHGSAETGWSVGVPEDPRGRET